MGRSPPDWWEKTPLDYPKTLDLSWPEKAEGGWNNQKHVGQYLWDVIHTWSSVVMIIGILLHLAAHWSWIKTITRRIFMRKASVERIVPDHEGVQ